MSTADVPTDKPTSAYDPRTSSATEVAGLVAARRRDDNTIKVLALVLIAGVVVAAVGFGAQTALAIDNFRTVVTQYFTWYLVAMATLALAYCLWMAISRRGNIVLGGPDAQRDYGNFAWYSMLFAAGQGIGLIFWSAAEPILVRDNNPIGEHIGAGNPDNGALIWTYFHWSLHAWAIYCVVALCLALAVHNRNAPMTFRDSVVMIFPERIRRGAGMLIEVIAIMATVFGLSTSFAFAALQLSSGLSATFGIEASELVRNLVILLIGAFGAVSVYIGIEKGMKRISEANSALSIVLLIGTLIFGPTLYIVSVLPETMGQYVSSLWWMGTWTDSAVSSSPLTSWADSWNGHWTVFIWSWCFAFSPFVGSFVARISRGRTVREFVVGVLVVPTVICVVWIGVIGATALRNDAASGGAVSDAIAQDVSMGLFASLELLPWRPAALILMAISTILVLTYYVTSLDSGVHALSGFVASAAAPSRVFRTMLVVGIAAIAFLLLSIGGVTAVSTVQTGTILGAIPLSVIVILMMFQAARQTHNIHSPINQVRAEEEDYIEHEDNLKDYEIALPETEASRALREEMADDSSESPQSTTDRGS